MSSLELALDGPAAPPRTNGELVFDAPWQTRAFGLAAALGEQGHLSWSEFQQALIEQVRRADDGVRVHAIRGAHERPRNHVLCARGVRDRTQRLPRRTRAATSLMGVLMRVLMTG